MSFSIGIVGLPNAGKSTLFKALTKKQVLIANYPFATIDPNVGVVAVPDARLDTLAKMNSSEKIVPTTVEFYDIAGLVKNAHKGEGLGNQFLGHIKEVDAIVHLVRGFSDSDVIHTQGRINPTDDLAIINLELAMADLAVVTKRLDHEQKQTKSGNKDAVKRVEIFTQYKKALEAGNAARTIVLSDEDRLVIKDLQLLTTKPVIYVINTDESNELLKQTSEELQKWLGVTDGIALAISAKIESELAELSDAEARDFMKSLNMERSGLDRIITTSYQTLNLITFLTAGPKETRAWTVARGTKAPQAAGVIHSDFEKTFIRVEITPYSDYVANGGEAGCKAKGLTRVEGKDYIIRDGDVCYFRVNA